MPNRTSTTGSELFIVDNSDEDWKVRRYLHDWCQISKAIDCATGHFEIGALLALQDGWQKVDRLRILMGNEVTRRTKAAFSEALGEVKRKLDESLEAEKEKNDFLAGVPAIVEGVRSGRIACRVYRKEKFHAKAYITHARLEVVGSAALVGSSNLSYPGLTENIELNVQITGRPVTVLQEWYEDHWQRAEDVTPEREREVKEARDPADDREVDDVADLTLGEYLRLLQKPKQWEKLGIKLDRKKFTAELDAVRNVRNDVMHFDPDGVGDEALATLRRFALFLRRPRQLSPNTICGHGYQ